jgi:four helix bundle protein
MENHLFGFEKLEVWKLARSFKKEVSLLTKKLPKDEMYRSTDQLIRCTRSVNALIAEGYGRFTYPDQIHYCIQARGSLNEAINHLIDLLDENIIDELTLVKFKKQAKQIEVVLNGYIRFLRSQKTK